MERNNRKSRFGPIPVKEGEEQEVTIEGIGEKGDGIAKVQGYVIIVPNTQKGERVKVKIKAVRGKVSFAEVIEKLGTATQEENQEPKNEENQSLENNSDEENQN
jgi:predicted RNA-binding protein with TRAM domain